MALPGLFTGKLSQSTISLDTLTGISKNQNLDQLDLNGFFLHPAIELDLHHYRDAADTTARESPKECPPLILGNCEVRDIRNR